jgi:hypothetical protein
MKKFNLPKEHFSYSQMSLWLRNKDQYRERYYKDGPAFENRETIFGKRVARLLETGEHDPVLTPVLARVPRGDVMEHRILVSVGGVPFLGFLDSFESLLCGIFEFKTGKDAWDTVRVHKHDQLVVYSLLVKLAHKKVHPITRLVWLETRFRQETFSIGSRVMEGDGDQLEFTGKIEVFERRIAQWERDAMKKQIVRVATEISEDYTKFLAK